MGNATEADTLKFLKAVDLYALTDIEKMVQVVDYENLYGRLAVPIALTCFSLLDILGFLIREIDYSKFGDGDNIKTPLKETEENLRASLSYFFKDDIKQNHVDQLITLYRHGLVHSFFPKNVGIYNSPDSLNFVTSNGQIWNFNVHYFAKYLVERIRKYINEFSTSLAKNNTIKNFVLYQDDCQKYFNKSVGSLPKSSNKIVEITSTTIPPSQTR